jgi:hypothetical protein
MVINKVNFTNYYKMAQISMSLNSFIRDAIVTKSQINSSMNNSITSITGIGKNIDILV